MFVPTNYNPADFYIQKLAIVPAKRKECLENAKVFISLHQCFLHIKLSIFQNICDGFALSNNMQDLKHCLFKANSMKNKNKMKKKKRNESL